MAEKQQKLFDVEYRSALFAFPVREMAKRGWIDVRSLSDTPRVKAELLRFFGLDTIDELEELATCDNEAFMKYFNRPRRAEVRR